MEEKKKRPDDSVHLKKIVLDSPNIFLKLLQCCEGKEAIATLFPSKFLVFCSKRGEDRKGGREREIRMCIFVAKKRLDKFMHLCCAHNNFIINLRLLLRKVYFAFLQ